MSAVSPAIDDVTTAVPVLEIAHSPAPSKLELETREQYRWMIWFGLPLVGAAVFIGLLFGTGHELFIAPAVALIVADILVLVWLAMSSDTNGIGLDPAAVSSHH
jgi:ABC-type dipeptide/oligopeptide/nickel transport system permease subunit